MAYVITGATGHIGNNIVKKLLTLNKEVKLILRKKDRSVDNLNVEYLIGNLFDEQFIASCINENDTVIHLAGAIDIKNKYRENTLKVNYELTKSITDICVTKKVKRYIYFSSVDAIYKEEDEEIFEPQKMYPEKFKDNYSYSKALATKYVMDIRDQNKDIKINILYPSCVFGINDFKPSAMGKVVKDIIAGKMEFGIKGGYNFVDVEDVTAATVNIIENQIDGDFILSGTDVTIKEFYTMANDVLCKKKHLFKIPIFLVHLAIPFVPYLSKFVLKTILENHNYNNSKMIEVLKVEQTPFRNTLEKTINFFKNEVN